MWIKHYHLMSPSTNESMFYNSTTQIQVAEAQSMVNDGWSLVNDG